jgi:hypothetical protein
MKIKKSLSTDDLVDPAMYFGHVFEVEWLFGILTLADD